MVILSLVIVRHGRTDANDNKIIQGHAPEPLNDVGRKEVDLLAKRLSKIEFTNVFSSDLIRAKQTTEVLVESLNFDKKNVIYDERLRERKFGVLEGQSIKLRTKLATEAKQPILEYTPQGGESFSSLQDRAAKFFEFLRDKLYKEICDCKNHKKLAYENLADENWPDDFAKLSPDGKIDARALLVTHGGLIREFLRYLLDEYSLKCADSSLNRSGVLKLSCNTALTEILVIFTAENWRNRYANKVQSIVCPVLNSISHLKLANDVPKRTDFGDSDSGV